MKKQTVILASGGTGGHLFPACSLGAELMDNGYDVLMLTDARGEKFIEKFDRPIPYKVISSDTIGAGIIGKIKSAWRISIGTLQSLIILLSKPTVAVIAFGGYPCFPPALAAGILFKPVILHEQNALLGRANRILAKFANYIATSFPNVVGCPNRLRTKIRFTGNPLRSDILNSLPSFNYRAPSADKPFNLLIVGGSQGASIFSMVIPQAIALLPEDIRHNISIIQQTREETLNDTQNFYDSLTFEIPPILIAFIDNMAETLTQSHLVITRAGASTVSELTALGIPAIYVPLAASLDGDQAQNAKGIVVKKGGWVITEDEFTPENLAHTLKELISSPPLLRDASINTKQLGNPNATQNLLELVEKTVGNKEKE